MRRVPGGAPGSFWEYQGRQLADWDSDCGGDLEEDRLGGGPRGDSEEDPAMQEALARSLRT